MIRLSDNMRGAALMVGSMTAFTVNDAFMKTLAGAVPLFQALAIRGVAVTLTLALMCLLLGQFRRDLSRRDWGLMVVRGLAEVAGAFLFLTALFNMPIANVSAILQALPLTVTLAGAIFLGEALGWRRLTAILVGFGGVHLIVQPGGADFTIYSLAALGAVAAVTLRDIVVRRMSGGVPSVLVALVAASLVTLAGGIASLFVEWVVMTPAQMLNLAGAAVFLIAGGIFSVAAMRWGELSFVAPFRYTSLLVALILGLVVFGEFPNPLALAGAGIVVATGLFTLYREARLARRV